MEDYTTFTLFGSRIKVQSATEYDFDDVGRNHNTYLWKDYGRHYFDDFEIQNDSIVTDIDNNGVTGGAFFIFGIGGDYWDTIYDEFWAQFGGFGAYWNHDGSPWDISFRIDDGHFGNNDSYGSVVTNTRYYFTYERSGTTFTCKIYDDAPRTNLLDTLTIQTTSRPLNILFAGSARVGSAKSRFWGETNNLNIISTTGSYTYPSATGAEDYTTYSVTASGTELEVESATRITFSNIRRNANNYANKDCGAGYFTNFKHSVNSSCTHIVEQVNDGGGFFVWAVSNEDSRPGITGWAANGGHHLNYGLSIAADQLTLNLYDWGTTNSDSYNAYGGAIYYCDIERIDTALTCKIYEDNERTVLLDTLSIVCENTAWRYLFAGGSVYSSNVRPWSSGWAEYLKLNELSAPTNPGISGPSDGAVNGEWPNIDLNIDVDEDMPGSSATVCFYDGDGNLIDCVEGAAPGESVGVSWGGLDCETEYSWYVVITSGGSSATSAIWTFTCGTCNVFTISSESYPTIHLSPPLWNTPQREINKDIAKFGFWSENWSIHDDGKLDGPLTLVGIEWIDDDGDESIFHKKFTDINAIMNAHEEVAISGVTDCIDGYYVIKSFGFTTVKESRKARKWTLNLEYSREKTW